MRKFDCSGVWWTVLLLVAACFVLAACGGGMEETDEEPAEEAAEIASPVVAHDVEMPDEEPAEDIQDAIWPDEEAAEPIEIAATETAAAQEETSAALPDVAPTPDFGSIAYDVPEHMVRSEEVQVILLVSPAEEEDLAAVLIEELEEVGQDPDNVQTATVEIAKRMSASLTSAPADAFEIVPLQASDEQSLLDDQPTQWEWTIVPLQGGTHRLILRIDRLVERDGIIEPFKEEVHRDDVTVEVPVGLRLQDAWGVFDFKWLAGVLLFPLLFYWLNRRDKKRDQLED